MIVRFARYLSLVALAAFAVIGAVQAAEPGEDQLIVFMQPGAGVVEAHFHDELLPQIREIAAAMKVTLVEVDVSMQGAPEEVAITPLIVFQNHRGRSIYQGRTSTLDRVKSFVRTSRYVPQGDAAMTWEQIPTRRDGRATVWSPVKISAVTGTPPPDYDDVAFQKAARKAIAKGFSQTRFRDSLTLGRADRGLYMDFYPWRAEDGTLFLSLALYSQFHCKEPVWELKKQPLTGPWADRDALFRRAAGLLEEAVTARMAEPAGGDGFVPVGKAVKTVTWAQLGLELPPPPVHAAAADVDVAIGRHWAVAAPVETDPPMVAFRFPAPLDAYSGYATASSGALHMGEDISFTGATGQFTVDMKSVTMGEADLDDALQSSTLFNTKTFPTSSFTITRADGDGTALRFGTLTPVALHGDFTLKGKTQPITAIMQAEPVLDEDLNLRLWLRGSFSIDITQYALNSGLDGPDGAGHTVVFDLNFVLKPTAE